jgi:hypothetical protein
MIGTSTTIASSIDNFTAYVSAELRCIDAETAVAWAADTGIELIAASSAIIPASS